MNGLLAGQGAIGGVQWTRELGVRRQLGPARPHRRTGPASIATNRRGGDA